MLALAGCGGDGSGSDPGTSTCNPAIAVGEPLTTLHGYIAFVGNGQLGAVCPDGSDLRTALAPVVDTAIEFRFDPSPDGRLVLVSYAQTSGAFDLIDVATGTTAPLNVPTLSSGERHLDATWSPDGGSIAYMIGAQQLVVGDVDGASVNNLRSLVNGMGDVFFGIGDPAWAPTGQRLAFSETDRLNGLGETLPVIDTVTRTITRIHPSAEVRAITQPAWSPDGSRIAVVSCCSGDLIGSLWVMNADGSNALALGTGTSPSWSPDGSEIAYVTGGDLWIVASSGGPGHELAHVVQPGARAARWVP
jgi:Tol biopolymer transport system component